MSKYIEQQPFSCGLSLVRNEKHEYAYINECGEEVVPFGTYSWCDPLFVCGYARVLTNTGWGIINTQGTVVIPLEYDKIWTLKEGYLSCIKAFQKEKEVTLNLFKLRKMFILDGLTYIKSFSVEEFKSTFQVSKIQVKKDIATNGLYMEYGSNIGAVALSGGIPKEPIISIVVNCIGDMFTMLHESEDLGKKAFHKKTTAENMATPKQVRKETGRYHKTSFADYENEKMNEDWSDPYGDIAAYNDGWDSDDVDSGLYDAYEGDYDEYNNR